MTLNMIDTLVVAVYFAGMLLFAVLVRRRGGFSDYTVADRSVPASIVFATLAATFIGPGYSLGLASKGASSGFFYLLPFSMFSVQTILVGWFLAPRLRALTDCHTLGDVMARFYGRSGKILTGVISLSLCLGLFAVMARAGGLIVANGLGIGLDEGVMLVSIVGVAYALTGGLRAVIATEAVQFGLMILIFSLLALFIAGRVASFEALQISAVNATRDAYEQMSKAEIASLCVSFFLGEALIPPYANRALAAASEDVSRRAFVTAGLFSVIWFAMIVAVGHAGVFILAPQLAAGDDLLIGVARQMLPSGLWGLFLVGIAAVVMSSQESVLNAGAVSCVRDIVLPFRARLTEHSQLVLARSATLLLAALGILVALQAPSLIEGLLVCYTLWAPTVLPPLVWGLLGLPTNRIVGTLSIVGGASGATLALVKYGAESTLSTLGFGFCFAALFAVVGALASRVTLHRRSVE